jgi:Amidohydrolase
MIFWSLKTDGISQNKTSGSCRRFANRRPFHYERSRYSVVAKAATRAQGQNARLCPERPIRISIFLNPRTNTRSARSNVQSAAFNCRGLSRDGDSARYRAHGRGVGRAVLCDTHACAKNLIAAAPERCLWVSDWPHIFLAGRPMPNTADLFELSWEWLSADDRQRVFVDNPRRLYSFD